MPIGQTVFFRPYPFGIVGCSLWILIWCDWFRKPRRLMAVHHPPWGSVSGVTGVTRVTCCSRFQAATAAASSCVVRLCRRRESWPRSTWWISSSQTWHWEKPALVKYVKWENSLVLVLLVFIFHQLLLWSFSQICGKCWWISHCIHCHIPIAS